MNDEFEIEIERYIKGEMSVEEAMNFEHRLEHDPEFKETYEATLAAHKVVEEAGRQELKYNMWSYENTPKKQKKTFKIGKRLIVTIAASIAILIGMSTFLNIKRDMSASEVFESYYQPYDPPSVIRDNSGGGSENWNRAAQHYAAGNYEDALRYFEIAEDNIHFTVIEFYEGLSYLQMDHPDYSNALYYLNEVRLEESELKEQANWYYALTLLKDGQSNEAEEVLKEIARERTYNHRYATEILKIDIEN
jgi:tetratricopeptide (TPR) repeat protein